MDEKQLQFLYNEYAKNQGFKDYSEFKGLMSSEGSRKLFFDNANKELGFKDYNEFNDLLGLKKKELSVPSGEVSSPTELQSVSQDISLTPKTPRKDYYSTKLEKGLIFDKEGQLYAPSSEALSKDITAAEQASLKKSTQKDLVEKSREMPVVVEPTEPIEEQGLLLNLISSLDKSFAKNFISSPIKALGTALQGGTKKVMGGTGEGFISEPLIKLGDYLNKTIDELTPQDEEFKGTLTDQVAQAFGQIGSLILTGGLTGAAGKGAALVSQIPKGSAALTAVKTLGSQLASPTAVSAGLSMGQAEFDRAKEAGATDDQAFEVFYKNAVTGSVLETIPVMQFFKRFNNTTGGSVANYIKTKGVAGLTGGIEEMTTEVMQQLYSNKTAKDIYNINQDILDGVGASGGIGFGVGFVLNAMGANARILRKQGKQKEADVLDNQVKQYEDNIENPKVTSGNKVSAKDIVTQGVEIGTQKAVQNLDRDLANNVITPEQYEEGVVFTEKAAQVVDKIPETVTGESKVKSVELLVERNDIKQANQNLLQQKQTADEAYHAGIDEEIKANEERIKKLDSEVYNIAKKPSKEFGDKKYVVDGEEVSKEAFEALTGKPIGTKEIIEVKPVETYEDKVKEILMNQMKAEGYRYMGAPSDLAKIPIEDVKSDVSEALKSFIKTTDGLPIRTVYRLRAEFEAKGYGDIPDGTKLEDIKDKIDSLKPSKRRSLEDDIYRKREEELDSLSYLPMTIKDDMTAADKKRVQDRREDIKKINDKYDAELAAVEVKEEVKPTEVKEEVKVKAPTKELAEGEEVTFNTPEGKKLTGEKITIPGFERIDMVLVKDGLNYTVYDLASGSGLGEGDFSKENAIEFLINQFKEKNITQPKIYGLIYKSTNTSSLENSKNRVPQINPSSMFEYYSGKRKALEKEEYEKLPLKFNSEEIKKLKELKKRAEDFGIDKMAKEIEGAIISRAKEGTFKPKTDYYEGLLKRDIDEKIKKEAEDEAVPYPKEYMKERPRMTMDKLKTIVNEGFKRDKFESIPEDVRKIMLDGYQKNIDILNKYGYYPDEKTKTFFDKLYQYVAAQTKRENRESQIAEAKKELISALDYLNKAHEKEFGKKAEAEVKPKEGEVKVYNAKDLKSNPEILKEDEDYASITYPKSFSSLYTDMFSLKNNGYEKAKIGDVINIFKKDYVIEAFGENKKNPDKTVVKLIRVDENGNILRNQDLSKKEKKSTLAKEFEEEEDVEIEEPEQITKDDIKKAEAKFAAAEDRFKKARNKIEATQVKQAGMFGGEQKGMFAMGGEEAKSTLDPLRKAAKEAKAELDNVRNRIKVQEAAQPELKPIEKSGLTPKEIRQKESEIAKDYYKTFPIGKIKDGSIFTDTKDTYSTFKFEIERQGKQVASETVSQIKKWAESRGLEYTGTSKEDIRKTIDFKLPFKESPYQKAVKEKLEADKRQNRQIGSEKAAITKEIYRKVNQMDAPADAEQIALRYLADGGKVSKEAIDEAYGSVKRAQLNTGRRELLSEEVKSKDFVQGNETLDETAHRLWEENNQRVSEIDIKNSLMAEIGNNNTRLEAAEAYLDNYNEEYKQEKEELRLAEQYKEEYLEEQEKIEKELREPLSEQIEGEASEEHINNLIDQYEAEIKGEDQQFGPASEGEVNKEASKRKVSEKTQEAELAKEFKEATKKAGKKAKENAKKDYVDRNFEYIKEKIKIEKKCPT